MGAIKERIKSGEECCKLANERFGLQMAIKKIMERFNCNDHAVDYVIELAKSRDLDKLDELLSDMGAWGINKARYVRIIKGSK